MSHSLPHIRTCWLWISRRFVAIQFVLCFVFLSYLLFLVQSAYLISRPPVPPISQCRFWIDCCESALLFHHTFRVILRRKQQKQKKKHPTRMGESKQNVRTFTNCWSCVNFVCQRHSIDENKKRKITFNENEMIQLHRRLCWMVFRVCANTSTHSSNAKWRSRHWSHDLRFVIVTLF